MSTTTAIQRFFEATRPVRYVHDPTAAPCFRSVTRIWHFPSGDAFLSRTGRRDCLLPDVDRVAVPASETRRIAGAVVIDTDATIRVIDDDERKVIEFDTNVVIGER
ncbi:hypothetical protein [Halorientalis halophila]|uniref:hypothetical protein n=1 Tax=Halorientalis halophila TaxID=3108499 RepID=UPI00300B1A90